MWWVVLVVDSAMAKMKPILQWCRNSECAHTQYQNVVFTWHLASMLGTGLRDGRIFRLVVIVSGILFLSNVSLLSVYLPGGNHIQGTSTHGDDSIWDDGPSNVVDNRLTEFTRIAGGNDVSPVAGSPMFAFKPAKPDRWWSDESREGKSGGLLMMPMGHKPLFVQRHSPK